MRDYALPSMSTRIGLTYVPVWQVGVPLALCCLFIWVTVKFGEKVYRSHALRTTGNLGGSKGTTEMGTHSTQ